MFHTESGRYWQFFVSHCINWCNFFFQKLTYFNIFKNYPGSYPTTHSHNIFLEPILSFGIIGTVILLVYLLYFYKRVITCHNAQNQIKITALILSLTCAILIHGTTDLTFMWIQTGLLYCLIMGGLGVEERMLKL